VGYCLDLFPWGGVCHGEGEETIYHQLCFLVRDEVEQLRRDGKEFPVPGYPSQAGGRSGLVGLNPWICPFLLLHPLASCPPSCPQ